MATMSRSEWIFLVCLSGCQPARPGGFAVKLGYFQNSRMTLAAHWLVGFGHSEIVLIFCNLGILPGSTDSSLNEMTGWLRLGVVVIKIGDSPKTS